ncbi:uncharacterized protein BDW47DRAFT_128830 [Aspergillus candidus]|uniref:Guanine nucleotide-exchange factor SEC12 n=1 Tax=Aspergillus candidus TaxID=41067 RepID=A0A2I2F237_ASPCN|nr:hypothetical protein BDW47DRAFT_128830 [Aspergillus candidus]PLB34703.1 hypothetical protein BDW47DRAFT_128830 [Aspergillus candidus]
MAPRVPSSKLTLSCPLFAADFDPRNPGFLLVAGGGGEGRSGVGNKIALLNTSKRNEISEIVDIELSRDEDSVTSLAVAHAADDSLVALAGINSSVAEQKRGNNQHLRSFKIDYPPRKSALAESPERKKKKKKSPAREKPTGTTTPLSRESLFRTTKSGSTGDTYQRITRLSPWKGSESPRVAAIATGLAPSGEIVFFDASSSTPASADVIGRIRLDNDEEAEDVDIIESEDQPGRFQVAYTNGRDVSLCRISSTTRSNAAPDVQTVYTIPRPEGAAARSRPKFRALRFLSPTALLLLQNSPDRTGCELILLDLGPAATPNNKDPKSPTAAATIVRRKKLRSTMKIGLGMDVCTLGKDLDNRQQTIVAVTGSDQSIEVITLESDPRSWRRTSGFDKFRVYTTLRDVHPFSVTKTCFSHFTPPAHPVTPETPPQSVKLASVSMGNTVVVHTFPLAPVPASSRTPRYVLSIPGESSVWSSFAGASTALLSILIVCFLVQAFGEIRGALPPHLGVADYLPPDIYDAVVIPYKTYSSTSLRPRSEDSSSSSSPSSPPPAIPTLNLNSSSSSSPLQNIILQARQHQHQQDTTQDQGQTKPLLSITCNPETNNLLIDLLYLVPTRSPHDQIKHLWSDLSGQDQAVWKKQLVDGGLLSSSSSPSTEAESKDNDENENLDALLQGDVLFGEVCAAEARV